MDFEPFVEAILTGGLAWTATRMTDASRSYITLGGSSYSAPIALGVTTALSSLATHYVAGTALRQILPGNIAMSSEAILEPVACGLVNAAVLRYGSPNAEIAISTPMAFGIGAGSKIGATYLGREIILPMLR